MVTQGPTSVQGDMSVTNEWKPGKVPVPKYRHAMPSGPWPWMNFNEDIRPGQLNEIQPPSDSSPASSEMLYPQSIFPNWTSTQVDRGKMMRLNGGRSCIYRIDVSKDASFDHGKFEVPDVLDNTEGAVWEKRPEGTRVRALFVENLTVPVLRMLGTKYNIEPFFFTSSVNWIPSRYQEDPTPSGDHITITLPFIRAVRSPSPHASQSDGPDTPSLKDPPLFSSDAFANFNEVIDTQAPLYLRYSDMLVLDLLSIHLVRSPNGNTIISYHPNLDEHRTGAEKMQGLLYYIGQSVYWNKIFMSTKDPTFVLLAMLWYVLYSWDESFEMLYKHINNLESSVINTTEIHLTRELHVIQAHLLYYATLLEDFSQTVSFVQETPHPGIATFVLHERERIESNLRLKKECKNLFSAISRMQSIRVMQSKRLENVMQLAFATVNIDDSRAMKQISYLSMIFLPASFTGTVFGMNVKELNGSYETLGHYALAAVLLTVVTVWTVVTFQANSRFHGSGPRKGFLVRLCWPIRNLVVGLEDLHAKLFQSRAIQGRGRDEEEGEG